MKMSADEIRMLGELIGHNTYKTMDIKTKTQMKGRGFWSNFSKGFKKGFQGVINPVTAIGKPVAVLTGQPEVAVQLGAIKGISDAVLGKGKKTKKPRKVSEKMKKRNELVKKIMKEKGLSLPQASKFIKTNNLM